MSNLQKSCILSSRLSFDPVCMKLCQNVWYHEMLDKIETGSSQIKKRGSFDQILERFTF